MHALTYLTEKFELARPGSDKLRPMEGTRGFAVLLVFLVHYITLMASWIAPASGLAAVGEQLRAIGNTGVDLFFVLSGYLIYGSLIARAQPFAPFIRRRLTRIYPAFLAVFLLYLTLSVAFPAQSKIPDGFWPALAYLVENLLLLPGLYQAEPMITVTWSLSYEMLYYLSLPALIGAFGLRARSVAARLAVFALLGLLIVAYSTMFGHIRLIMFIAGIFLYEAMQNGRLRRPGGLTGLLALAAGLGLAANTLTIGGEAQLALQMLLLAAAFCLFCWSCFGAPAAPLGRAFAWTPLRWLGNMSYSFYLLHGLVLKAAVLAMARLLPPAEYQQPALFWAMLAPLFLLTLLAATILFLLVERPFSLSGAHAQAAVPAAPPLTSRR